MSIKSPFPGNNGEVVSDFKYARNLTIGKVGFNAMKQEELIGLIEDIPMRDDSCAYVVFAGVPSVVLAHEAEEVAASQNGATICAMDGMPIAKMALKRGIECERCGGPDIMIKIIERGIPMHKRHYLYGSSPETIKRLELNLKELFPEIQIVGKFAPPYRELTAEEDREVVSWINAAKPDYVWVGLGAPKQDLWMQAHQHVFHNCILMGVGAAFDFYSGTVKRAPEFMRNLGFEWLYRLLREPGRLWRRYLLNGPKFLVIRHKDNKRIKAEQREAKNRRLEDDNRILAEQALRRQRLLLKEEAEKRQEEEALAAANDSDAQGGASTLNQKLPFPAVAVIPDVK